MNCYTHLAQSCICLTKGERKRSRGGSATSGACKSDVQISSFEIAFFDWWSGAAQINKAHCGAKATCLHCRPQPAPPPSAIACVGTAWRVLVARKEKAEETLKYLSSAKINKPRYSLQTL